MLPSFSLFVPSSFSLSPHLLLSLLFLFRLLIVSSSDSRRSRMRSLIIHITVPWSPHTHTHTLVSSFLLFHLVPSTGLCVSQKAVMTDERNRVSCPIKLGVYWGQTTGTHTQRQSSRPLLIRAEGLCLLAPYIRRHTAWRRLVGSNSRGSHAMSGGFSPAVLTYSSEAIVLTPFQLQGQKNLLPFNQ